MTRGIVGILLAAGAASRYGAPKLSAARVDGRPIGELSAERLVRALPDSIAVVRPGADELAASLAACGLQVVVCPEAHTGMGASLASGVQAAADAEGWVVALADMPYVDPAIIESVAAAVRAGAPVAAPYLGAERGHPVGFGAALRDELAALHGDVGARDILQRHRERIVRIETEHGGVLFDVDTPADLRRPEPGS